MTPSEFERAWARIGKRLAATLRRLLPTAVLGGPAARVAAEQRLRRAADEASVALGASARVFIQGDAIIEAVALGGRRGSAAMGLSFGGVNTQLAGQLQLDLARDLAVAADSTRPFLTQALRRATAITAARDVNRDLTQELLRGVIAQRTPRQQAAALLAKLGLEKGDRVLFMSGRTLEASYYSKLVARTRLLEANNLAYADVLTRNGQEFIETSAHGGVEPDDICAFLQGKVWALRENALGIPVLPPAYGLPPWHPNCRHTFAVWNPDLEGDKAVAKVIRSHSRDEQALDAWDGKTVKPKK